MKKLLVLFTVLLTVFLGGWVFKSKEPAKRPDDGPVSVSTEQWWTQKKSLPKADQEWILDAEIEPNYIPVPGENELYMVIDSEGYITAYRRRTKQPDGSWLWETVNPDIPSSYEPVPGLENVYKVTDETGEVSYFLYIRNKDDTFAFVPVDENGQRLDTPKGGTSDIPETLVHVDENVYANYDEHGVLTGFYERYIAADGSYYWKETEEPEDWGTGLAAGYQNIMPALQNQNISVDPLPQPTTPSYNGGGETLWTPSTEPSHQHLEGGDGTYTEIETITSTEHKDGWIITYQTTVTKIYDANGELLSTKRENPVEIDRRRSDGGVSETPDASKIAPTLTAEIARIGVGLSIDTGLTSEVVAQINAQRAASGASALTNVQGTTAYNLATAKAYDMAIYDYSGYSSPLYGTIANMCSRFGISATSPSDLNWKTPAGKTASAIAEKLIAMSENALKTRNVKEFGLAITEKNGYLYVALIVLD